MANYRPKDHYYQQAKRDQYAARSVYKLQELDKRFHVLKKGATVLDFGCAPGFWLQYIANAIGKKGVALGYDLEPVSVGLPSHVAAYEVDVQTLEIATILEHLKALRPESPVQTLDVVLSDMAPKLTGINDADQARALDLVEIVSGHAQTLLRPGGHLVAKAFQGRGIDELLGKLKQHYKKVKLIKPDASRDGSRESFLVALEKKS